MKIVFLGSSSFGLPSLEAIADSRHTLAGVFTQPARPAGRHRDPKPTDVAAWMRRLLTSTTSKRWNLWLSTRSSVNKCLKCLLPTVSKTLKKLP